jgi:hypothetical protein
MSQWEYRKIDLNDLPRKANDVDVLNDAGDEEWELVGITTNNFAYLKREIEARIPEKAAPRKSASRAASKQG